MGTSVLQQKEYKNSYKISYKMNPDYDDKKYIELKKDGLVVGYLEFEEIYSNIHWWFDAENFDGTDCESLFPDDKMVVLSTLYIDKEFRNMGLGNMLMKHFIQVKEKLFPGFDHFVLNAYPMEFAIPIEALTGFYNKYGFRELYYQNNFTGVNCVMVMD